VIIGQEHVYFR